MLAKAHANLYVKNKSGFTALHLAAQNGHNQSSRVLLMEGCGPDVKNNVSISAIHSCNIDYVKIIVSKKGEEDNTQRKCCYSRRWLIFNIWPALND